MTFYSVTANYQKIVMSKLPAELVKYLGRLFSIRGCLMTVTLKLLCTNVVYSSCPTMKSITLKSSGTMSTNTFGIQLQISACGTIQNYFRMQDMF